MFWKLWMSYRRFYNRFFGWLKNQRMITLVFSAAIVFLSLPFIKLLPGQENATIVGIPRTFFFVTLAAPVIGLFILSVFNSLAEDNDRHDPKLENE